MEMICQKEKVLVVDDEPLNVELISGYLEQDYQIFQAHNGKEALDNVILINPDIILLDIMMPDVNGYDVCKKIKQQESTRFIPVLMVTALVDVDDKIKAIESGADDYLTKPINKIELFTRVKSLLRSKNYHDQLVRNIEKIKLQDEFKTIMTNILPLILQSIPPGKMNEVICQMSEQVEDVIWDKYIGNLPEDILQTANISCAILNKLGGNFSVREVNNKGYSIINDKCPWGENLVINPVLCMMTKAIIARIGVHVYKDINVCVKKTIAGKDGHCLIEIFLRDRIE